MSKIILDPYDSFRTGDFTAVVSEMGIKPFGEEEVLKAYIAFEDGGAPLTFPIAVKGQSVIENSGKIKNFGLGAFADKAKKLGIQTYIDPDTEEFGTIPSLIGAETEWKAEKGKKRIDADGNEKEGYTNFILTSVKLPSGPAQPHNPAAKPTETKSTASSDIYLQNWKEALTSILTAPKTIAEVQKELNEMSKTATNDQKIIYVKMAGTRVAAIKNLKENKFIIQDENQKLSLVE